MKLSQTGNLTKKHGHNASKSQTAPCAYLFACSNNAGSIRHVQGRALVDNVEQLFDDGLVFVQLGLAGQPDGDEQSLVELQQAPHCRKGKA